MKKLIFIYLFLIGICVSSTAQIQNRGWALPPNQVLFNGVSPVTLTSSTIHGGSGSPYIVSNGAYDDNGNLKFYVKDNLVYEPNGVVAGSLSEVSGCYTDIQHEVIIVPFNDQCKYYLIYLMSDYPNSQGLMYTEVDMSTGSPVVNQSNMSHGNPFLIDDLQGLSLGGIAISPLVSNVDSDYRFLYCVAYPGVKKYRVDDSGIALETVLIDFSTNNSNVSHSSDFETVEVDLSWEENYRLGWSSVHGEKTFLLDLNAQGDYDQLNIVDWNWNFQQNAFNVIVGFEFNPQDNNHFFISGVSTTGTSGIYDFNLLNNGPQPVPNYITDSEECISHLELGRDDNIYGVKNANLGYVDYGSPTTFNNATVTNTVYSDQNSFAYRYGIPFYTLPDQVDGVENVFHKFPLSNFLLEGNALPTSAGSPFPTFDICSPMFLDDFTQFGHEYKITLTRVDQNGNTLITPPTQPWLSFLNTNLKSISFDSFQNLSTWNNYGFYKVTVEVKNACGVTDSRQGFFEVLQPLVPNPGMTINGSQPNSSLPTTNRFNVYNCTGTTIDLDNTGYNANGYKVTLESSDQNGNVITGTGYVSTSTNIESDFNAISDLKNLPAIDGTWLANPANTGYYRVTLTTYYNCSDFNDYNRDDVGYIYLNSTPSASTMLLSVGIKGGGQCSSKSLSSNCITGNFATLMNMGISGSTFSSNSITSFKIKIEEVDCSSGAIGNTIYNDINPQFPLNPNNPITGYSLNGLNISGSTGYFANKFDDCFKLTVEVDNPCNPSVTDWTYFQITDTSNQFRLASKDSDNEKPITVKLYPNPTSNSMINLDYSTNGQGFMNYRILDKTGRELYQSTLSLNEINASGTIPLNLDDYSSGIYFLELIENENKTVKKFIIQ